MSNDATRTPPHSPITTSAAKLRSTPQSLPAQSAPPARAKQLASLRNARRAPDARETIAGTNSAVGASVGASRQVSAYVDLLADSQLAPPPPEPDPFLQHTMPAPEPQPAAPGFTADPFSLQAGAPAQSAPSGDTAATDACAEPSGARVSAHDEPVLPMQTAGPLKSASAHAHAAEAADRPVTVAALGPASGGSSGGHGGRPVARELAASGGVVTSRAYAETAALQLFNPFAGHYEIAGQRGPQPLREGMSHVAMPGPGMPALASHFELPQSNITRDGLQGAPERAPARPPSAQGGAATEATAASIAQEQSGQGREDEGAKVAPPARVALDAGAQGGSYFGGFTGAPQHAALGGYGGGHTGPASFGGFGQHPASFAGFAQQQGGGYGWPQAPPGHPHSHFGPYGHQQPQPGYHSQAHAPPQPPAPLYAPQAQPQTAPYHASSYYAAPAHMPQSLQPSAFAPAPGSLHAYDAVPEQGGMQRSATEGAPPADTQHVQVAASQALGTSQRAASSTSAGTQSIHGSFFSSGGNPFL
jgi:hypothetical protein